ncbi:MAG: hypothetical protein M0Z27_02945 [Thermaerobacter sp.]|nr:hypothetical protein [Thermaerobacter sp.]
MPRFAAATPIRLLAALTVLAACGTTPATAPAFRVHGKVIVGAYDLGADYLHGRADLSMAAGEMHDAVAAGMNLAVTYGQDQAMLLDPSTPIGSLFRRNRIMLLDNTTAFIRDVLPFPVHPGQTTVPIAHTVAGTSVFKLRPVTRNGKPLPSRGTLQIGGDTVRYTGIVADYGTLNGQTYSALTGCTVTGPENPVPARTMVLNSPGLAAHLARIAVYHRYNLWGFYTKDDFFYGDQELAALQQEYAQIKASFPGYPVVAGYGAPSRRLIASAYGPRMADLVFIYLYPFEKHTAAAKDLATFRRQLATLLRGLHRYGPRLPWVGVLQANLGARNDHAIPSPGLSLRQTRIYLRRGAAGLFSFQMIDQYRIPALRRDVAYGDELAAQTLTPGKFTVRVTKGGASLRLSGTATAFNLPGGLTATLRGPTGSSSLPIRVAGPAAAAAKLPVPLASGGYVLTLNNPYWLRPLGASFWVIAPPWR